MILFKKLLRTMGKYKAQFISMVLMIALGVGVFFGFNMEWFSIEKGTDKFFTSSNYADFRVYSTTGVTAEDKQKIDEISGVTDSTRWLTTKVGVTGTKMQLALCAAEDYGISKFTLISGKDYDKEISDGVWLSDKFAETNNYKLGDTISLEYGATERQVKIVGLIKSAEFMVCVEENQLMPDFTSYGFCYVSPKFVEEQFGTSYYNQIYIKSNLSKDEMEKAINSALQKNMLVLSLDENTSYQAAKGEADEGKTMGSILPVLFLLIAVLTMITTMHRITKNEKVQIGTLKALGFKDRKILWHYTCFGFSIGVFGSVLGTALGYLVARILMSPTGMMGTYFDWVEWKLYMPWFCPLVLVLIVLVLTGVCLLTVKSILNEMLAETLRPYVPKKVKQTKLEKTKLWNKCSFGFKWNYRDIIRNPSRLIVTLVGVIGCVILIVASFGMKDSMAGFMSSLKTTMNYNTKINISETATKSEIELIENKYTTDSVSSVNIKLNGENKVLEVYSADNELVKVVDYYSKVIKLRDDGVYICSRIADTGIKVGEEITFIIYGTDVKITAKVVGINKSQITETITMTKTFWESLGMEYRPTALFTNTAIDDIEKSSAITSVQEKDKLIATYNTFLELMNTMILVLVVAALALAIIVLYNLGVMNYTERYREFATLKVVGFKDKSIARLLIGQNVWLTLIGTIIGLPCGYGVFAWMIKALASEYELTIRINFLSYLLASVLTILVSVFVGILISLKNRKIDMVEALKDKE